MNTSYKIIFAHGDDASRAVVTEMLKVLGHQLQLVTHSGREMIAAVKEQPPELLISGVRLSDMDGIESLVECGKQEPIPSIIVSKETDQDKVERALQDHVMAYLAEPVQTHDLRPAIFLVMQRFSQFQELREENEELREALQLRKWVERAKGLLMKQRDLDEEGAYKQLRRMATDKRTKIGEVAKTLVEADELLSES
ncbi:ANTAR domain-containing response regulator [Roseiconus nitratireducens]|nr:ANTAR domain-containing protein [Roseiconus nitratireducens]